MRNFQRALVLLLVIAAAEPTRLHAAGPAAKLSLVRTSDKGIEEVKAGVYGVAAARDNKHVLVGGDSASTIMTLWNIETGETDQYFDLFVQETDGNPFTPALSPDGKIAAASTTLGKIFLFESDTGNVLKKFERGVFAPSICFSPDSKQLALVDLQGNFVIVDTGAGQKPFEIVLDFLAHSAGATSVDWSSDGKRIVTGSSDKTARLWKAGEKTELQKIEHPDWVWSAAFSPDSRILATGTGGPLVGSPSLMMHEKGNDNRIRLWNVETGKLVRELNGHADVVRTLAFTPDGKKLVSGSFDHSLRLWDVATGQELAKAEGKCWVNTLAITPDSKTVISGGGSMRVQTGWKTFPEERLRVFRIEE